MSKALQQVLGRENLIGVYSAIRPGVIAPLPASFYSPSRTIEGNTGTYIETTGSRKTSNVVRFGAKASNVAGEPVGEKPVTLAYSSEALDIDPVTLMYLMSEDGGLQRLGESEVARRLAEKRTRHMNLRQTLVHLALCKGEINFDSRQLLPDSTGAIVTVNYNVPASNKDQLQDVTGATIITASWATATTDIVGQVELIKTTALIRTGVPLRFAIYGKNILGYLCANDCVGDILNGNPGFASAFGQGSIPDPFFGLTWINGDTLFWQQQDGTLQKIVGDDEVKFLPDPNVGGGWYDMAEGTAPVPTSNDVFASPEAAMASIQMAPGMWIYATAKTNPVTAEVVSGDTFLPIVNNGSAIYLADVTP